MTLATDRPDRRALDVGLSLGSNLGDRMASLREACRRLLTVDGVTLLARAPVYETEPVDVRSEHLDKTYLNTVVLVSFAGEVRRLAAETARIESDMGRRRTADRNAPRPIDIDILFAGDLRVDDGALRIPHPRWHQRRFVVQPLADICPGLRIPGHPRTVAETLLDLPSRPSASVFAPTW